MLFKTQHWELYWHALTVKITSPQCCKLWYMNWFLCFWTTLYVVVCYILPSLKTPIPKPPYSMGMPIPKFCLFINFLYKNAKIKLVILMKKIQQMAFSLYYSAFRPPHSLRKGWSDMKKGSTKKVTLYKQVCIC